MNYSEEPPSLPPLAFPDKLSRQDLNDLGRVASAEAVVLGYRIGTKFSPATVSRVVYLGATLIDCLIQTLKFWQVGCRTFSSFGVTTAAAINPLAVILTETETIRAEEHRGERVHGDKTFLCFFCKTATGIFSLILACNNVLSMLITICTAKWELGLTKTAGRMAQRSRRVAANQLKSSLGLTKAI